MQTEKLLQLISDHDIIIFGTGFVAELFLAGAGIPENDGSCSWIYEDKCFAGRDAP